MYRLGTIFLGGVGGWGWDWSSKRPGVSIQGRGGYLRDQGPQANGGGGHVRD